MGHRRWRHLDVLADDDGAGTRVDDHLGHCLAWVDFQVLQDRQVVHPLAGVHRRAHAHRTTIHGLGHAWAEQVIDLVDDVLGGGEVGAVEVQGQGVALVETAWHCPLNAGAARDTAGRRYVDGDPRAVAAFGIEAAYHQVALGDGVDVAVDALERGHQQAAPAQALGVTDRRYGDVHHLPWLGESRQVGMHRHRSDVLQLHVARSRRHLDAELREHVVERLQGERRLRGLVAGTVEADDQAVADQLVGAYARDAGDVLQALGLRRAGAGQQQGGGEQLPQVEHGQGTQKGQSGLMKKRSSHPGWLASANEPVPE